MRNTTNSSRRVRGGAESLDSDGSVTLSTVASLAKEHLNSIKGYPAYISAARSKKLDPDTASPTASRNRVTVESPRHGLALIYPTGRELACRRGRSRRKLRFFRICEDSKEITWPGPKSLVANMTGAHCAIPGLSFFAKAMVHLALSARSARTSSANPEVRHDPVPSLHRRPPKVEAGIVGSLHRDIMGLLLSHYARSHTEILTVPQQPVVDCGSDPSGQGPVHDLCWRNHAATLDPVHATSDQGHQAQGLPDPRQLERTQIQNGQRLAGGERETDRGVLPAAVLTRTQCQRVLQRRLQGCDLARYSATRSLAAQTYDPHKLAPHPEISESRSKILRTRTHPLFSVS